MRFPGLDACGVSPTYPLQRLEFVDVVDHFPSQCQYVIEALKVIYENDAEARKEKMSPVERLAYHQLHSSSRRRLGLTSRTST